MKVTSSALGKLMPRTNKSDFLWDNRQPQVLMNQIAWALLMIFVMAFILSNTAILSQLTIAKNKLAYYRQRVEKIQATDKGQAVLKLEANLKELQRQLLLNALDKYDHSERERMFITSYLSNGLVQMENILVGDKINDRNFINGCNYAHEQFTAPDLNLIWFDSIISGLGMTAPAAGTDDDLDENNYSKKLTKENGEWLKDEILARITTMRADMASLEDKIGSLLQDHFKQLAESGDTSFLKDTEVGAILNRYLNSDEGMSGEIVSLTIVGIREHVKRIIVNSEIRLLPEIMK